MPPQVALLLCIAFVFYQLRADRPKTNVSWALWIPTLWFLYSASRPLIYWLGAGTITEGNPLEDGSTVDRSFLTILILLGTAVLVSRPVKWDLFKREHAWLIALYVYAMLSAVWADITLYVSLKRFVKFVGGVLMALVIFSEAVPREALVTVFKRLVYILVPFSLVLIKYFPALGRAYTPHSGGTMWIGVTGTKNGFAGLCMISAFFLIWNYIVNRRERNPSRFKLESFTYLSILMMSLYMLRADGAYSATALVCLPVGLLTLLLLVRFRKRQLKGATGIFLVPLVLVFFVGTCLPFVGTSSMSSVAALLGRDGTMTGRSEIWASLTPHALGNAFLGHGYGGFWSWEMLTQGLLNEAHNGYLAVILELGFVGLCLLFALCVSYYRKLRLELWQPGAFGWAAFGIGLLLMLVLHEITEAAFLVASDVIWMSLIFVCIGNSGVETTASGAGGAVQSRTGSISTRPISQPHLVVP